VTLLSFCFVIDILTCHWSWMPLLVLNAVVIFRKCWFLPDWSVKCDLKCWLWLQYSSWILHHLAFHTHHPNSLDNIVHTAVKGEQYWTFEKLLIVSCHYSCSVAFENSLDQKLSSHFLIYKNSSLIYDNSILIFKRSVLDYITSNLTFEAHVIRTLNSLIHRKLSKFPVEN